MPWGVAGLERRSVHGRSGARTIAPRRGGRQHTKRTRLRAVHSVVAGGRVQEGDQPVPDGANTTGTRSPIPFRTTPPSTDQPPVCRFLAREAPDGTLGPPGTTVDPSHRCVALIDPLPQSARQQELVCLTGAHTSCPRYL